MDTLATSTVVLLFMWKVYFGTLIKCTKDVGEGGLF